MPEITSLDPNAILFGAKLPSLCKPHCEGKTTVVVKCIHLHI
jgi:hypothetical protein